MLSGIRSDPVSYTHLDVYKRQDWIRMQIKIAFQDVTADQAKKAVIAYEPIWAIGTGETCLLYTSTAGKGPAQEIRTFCRCDCSRRIVPERPVP